TIKESQENHFALMRQLQELESGFGQVLEREQHWSRVGEEVELAGSVLPRPPAKISDAAIRKAAAEMERIRVGEERPSVIRRWLNRWRVARVRRQLQIPKQEEISLQDLRALIAYHSMTLQMHDIERSFRSVMPADQAWNALKRVERELRSSSIEQLNLHRSKRLRRLLSDSSDRAALRDLAALLRRRKEDLKIQLQQSLTAELLLDAFPAWACTSRTLCEILPATPGLFDLVVIDEASQCDLALASVALMRAKRAVVVGDPNQLRHVCFLSRAREQASFVRNRLSEKMQLRFQYRRSLFDVASDSVETRNFFFLNEHFRSHPQIIDFSNRQFYDGSLSIMTERPSTGLQKAIRIEHVDGCRVLESSVNPTELARVISIIDEQVAANDNRSIGIISPFRDQADAIKEQLVRHLSAESLRKHDLVVGTAHSLQGDEKDIVILSTSIDGDSHPASLRFLESPNLFNVAVTRAREQLIIVTSVSAEQLPVGMLREFLVHAESNWQNGQESNVTECELEQEIIHQLDAEGIPCLAGYQAAGTRIDIVAVGERRSVAILCDRPERTDWEQVLETQRRLSRASWPTVRLSRRLVEQHWDVCINTIRKKLG
ncbi:MAG: AAA domain-containing protein, partial [Planctomycetota bacterium]